MTQAPRPLVVRMRCGRRIGLWRTGSVGDARRLLVASLIYLPVLLGVMALDKLAS